MIEHSDSSNEMVTDATILVGHYLYKSKWSVANSLSDTMLGRSWPDEVAPSVNSQYHTVLLSSKKIPVPEKLKFATAGKFPTF